MASNNRIEDVMNRYQATQDKIDAHFEKNTDNVEVLYRTAVENEIRTHQEGVRVMEEINLQHNAIRHKRQKQHVKDHTRSWAQIASVALSVGVAGAHFTGAYKNFAALNALTENVKRYEEHAKMAAGIAGGLEAVNKLPGAVQQGTLTEHNHELSNYDQTYNQNNTARDSETQKKERQLQELQAQISKEHQDKAALLRS